MEPVKNIKIDYSTNEKYTLSKLQEANLTIENLVKENYELRMQLETITKNRLENISYKNACLLKDDFAKFADKRFKERANEVARHIDIFDDFFDWLEKRNYYVFHISKIPSVAWESGEEAPNLLKEK